MTRAVKAADVPTNLPPNGALRGDERRALIQMITTLKVALENLEDRVTALEQKATT